MNGRRAALAFAGVAAGLAVYWLLDVRFGPFATARVYETPGVSVWQAVVSPTHWLWYAALLAASLAALAALAGGPWRAPSGNEPRHPWRVVIFLALAAAMATLALRGLVLRGAPLFDDEMIYRFQAQTIAQGRLTAAPPPDVPHFKHNFLGVWRGRWFGQYSFGHPAILALGERLGLPGLIGALETAAMVLLIYLLAWRLFDRRTALVAAFLAAISPLLLSTGATTLSQNSATPLVLAGILFTLRAADTGRGGDTLAAALALGAAFWCRQSEPALLGLGPLALLVIRVARGPRRWPILVGGAVGTAAVFGPLLLLQNHLWGSPLWTNYQAYWWGFVKLKIVSPFGFGLAPLANHTPAKGLLYTVQNLAHLDVFLLGLPGASILAVAGLAAHRRNRETLAVFAGAPLTAFALFFYFWPSLADTGPQLYHAVGAALLPFVAAGFIRLLDRLRQPSLAVAAVFAIALATFWPAQIGALARSAWGANELPRLVAARGIHRAIVFARQHPWPPGYRVSPVGTLPVPRPDLSDDVLFLATGGTPVDRALAETYFPDRATYFLAFLDGKVALLPLAEHTGRAALQAAAVPRDVTP